MLRLPSETIYFVLFQLTGQDFILFHIDLPLRKRAKQGFDPNCKTKCIHICIYERIPQKNEVCSCVGRLPSANNQQNLKIHFLKPRNRGRAMVQYVPTFP